jgi:hypothetical protein
MRLTTVLLALSALPLLNGCAPEGDAPTDLSDIDARFEALEGAAEAQREESAAANAALETRIATLEADAAETNTYVAEVEARVLTLEQELAALEGSVDITALDAAVADHDARLASVEGAGYATEDWVTSQGYGYDSDVAALDTRLTTAEGDISGLESDLADGGVWDSSLEALFTYLTVDDTSDTLTFSGANLYVNNGAGATASTNGYGNLVIGYNEASYGQARTGSHNLVVGPEHNWTSYGGLIAGDRNTVTGPYSSVSGGRSNTASGAYSSVSGGYSNTASGSRSSVSGGYGNTASGQDSSVSGGLFNTASGPRSSVSGGDSNTASNTVSSVSGGYDNDASGAISSVSGGLLNTASGLYSSVSGGYTNTASGAYSSVSGGNTRTLSSSYSYP